MSDVFYYNMIFFARIILAGLCGASIGYERQQHFKLVGIKTHAIISISAALMMVISKYGFNDVLGKEGLNCDVSRVAAGIITGIGIMGGGIVVGKHGNVSGITTASGVWATIGIGMAIGSGMYIIGIASTVVILIIQSPLFSRIKKIEAPRRVDCVLNLDGNKDTFNKVEKKLKQNSMQISSYKWDRKSKTLMQMRCQLMVPGRMSQGEILNVLTDILEVESVEVTG